MDPEKLAQWQAADALFDQWLDQPAAERAAWLARREAEPAVLQRLQQLIAAHQRPRASMDPAGSDLSGCQLGDWTLESELGRGGMAVVYRASREQGMARQQAAVKILTLGALGATGRERFHREAAILARLNHPNVTALVDSGVAEDGTCWLAMPLVDGQRIDDWCDAKSLDAREIVRLYLQVCDAVAYAHRNLVIHRDLKPSNVLVDRDGHVRLLDFGIGQFADDEGERTHTMWRALTPGYAAPEQLRGAPPTTAMDIYGLGALLHRLLTGRTPGADGTTHSTRPSLLVRDAGDAYHRHYVPLKSDLDRVLLKALAEEPEQRYPTAEALADDLRRWLDGRPVLAEKPKLGYRARKFLARNKVGVAAAGLLVLALAGGVSATLWQAGEARREAENARAQAQRAILVREFLQRVFYSTQPAVGGVPDALELLEEGARRARSEVLQSDPLAAADILMLTGSARAGLGEYALAQADLEQASSILRDSQPRAYPERVQIEGYLSQLARYHGENTKAQQHGRAAVGLGELALAEDGDAQPLLDAQVSWGMSLFVDDPAAALEVFEEVYAALPDHGLTDTPLHISVLDGLSAALMAVSPEDTGRLAELAEEQMRLSREIDGPGSSQYVSTLSDQVPVFSRIGDLERAAEVAWEAVRIAEQAFTGPHRNKAGAHCQLAANLHWQGDYAQAVEHYSIANGMYSELGLSDLHVQACFMYAGYARAALGDYHSALEDLEHAWAVLGDHDYRATPTGYSNCGTKAAVYIRLGDADSAERLLDGCEPAEGHDPPLMYSQARAELHFSRGELAHAANIAAGLRRDRPPEADDRYWMRPWMLSILLAGETGDTGLVADLEQELGGFAASPPLSMCLQHPSREHCLALP